MGPQYILVFAVCFLASLLGPLCGIGGGVIIKPVVDAMNVMSVSTVSFLSSMSVLIMSLSTLAQNAASGQSDIDARAMSPIAVSSAVGGVIGKMLFNRLGSVFPDAELVGAVQAAVLIVLAVLVPIAWFIWMGVRLPKTGFSPDRAVASGATFPLKWFANSGPDPRAAFLGARA